MKTIFRVLFFIQMFSVYNASFASTKQNQEKVNLIIINIDDMGWRDVGFMGSEYYETPNIDKLASEGMAFNNAYAGASNCAPSRACMMSGQWTPRHGIYTVGSSERGKKKDRKLIPVKNNEYISENNLLLPQVLQKAGYVTCHAGKWHLSDNPKTFGFQYNIGGSHAGNPGSYYPPYKNVPSIKAISEDDYLTNQIMDNVLDFIDSVNNGPFFLYYAPYAVHSPLQPVKSLLSKYQNKKQWNGQDNVKYATMVENVDTQIGRLVKKLEEKGVLDNTFIVFTSDNGGVYNITKQWPLRAGKGSYYEGGIRVPTFFYWKDKIKGHSKSDIPISNLDFYPTLLDAANIDKPADKVLDGMSLLPFLTESKIPTDRALYWHFPIYLEGGNEETQDPLFRTRPGSAIRYGDWKLIQYFENNEIELYNLKKDIKEKKNLSETNKDKKEELLEMLKLWRNKVHAPVPEKLNPDFSSK